MKITVIGRKFSETATYCKWDTEKNYPQYEIVEEQTWEIEADTLRDGEKWLAENHPDMYMGGNVICENGDFACLAIPCIEYGKGNYETMAARIATVRRLLNGMKRLTKWNGKKWTLPQGAWREIADRLAAYENTGLEPEEILKLKEAK